jgi:hypothetical protein
MPSRVLDSSALDITETSSTKVCVFTVLALVARSFMSAAAGKSDGVGNRHSWSSDDTDRMFDMHEAMDWRVIECREARCVAGIAQVVVGAVHALVAIAVDDFLARIAPIG